MTEKRCPNCDEPTTVCNGSYSQGCWQAKAMKLGERLQRLEGTPEQTNWSNEERVLASLDDDDRLKNMEVWFSGALHVGPGATGDRLPICYRIRQENLALLLILARRAVDPLPIAALYCPVCKTRHIDEGAFATKRHHTHACQGFVEDNGKRRRCGHVWRPALVATTGVEALPGFINVEAK